jgi:aspartyl-tRNA(Asn)/glutamyl-tRNA(Gln) amidotransferase subunit A
MISRLPNISKAVDAIRRGELFPLDLVDYCLIRIEQLEPRVRAWVSVDAEGARREAARLGTLARAGSVVGPLHGIPIGIKDIIDVAGWPTRAGSPLRFDHIAAKDAEIVERLRRAGAIILGKTVTTEFASFDPPPTRNPWNLEHTPGGSSSGSAAAVALEMCCAAIGSQTGGSIVRPASYCGVAGLKPTLYSVSLEGVVPLSPNLDHGGPLARSVADLGVLYQVLQRVDSAPANSWTPKLSWSKGFFWDRADKEVRQVTEQAVRLLGDMVENRDWQEMPASFSEVHACHRCLMAVDAAEYHRATFAAQRNEYGRHIAGLIEEGLHASAVDYAHALRLQKQFSTEFQNALGTTILVTPSTPTPAPGLETTGDPAFNSPWSFAGVPTVTIPCGLASNGLPCGLQLIAAKLDEGSLLAAAEECERRLGFADRPMP